MVAVIMAGGKGTRIRSINSEVPKPMIPVLGKPILEYQLQCMKENGITDIILVVGYLGTIIKDHFKDGQEWGVSIRYIEEEEPLGTAGALYYLKDMVNGDFLFCNGDIVFDIDIQRFYAFHKEKGGIATLFTHPNNHPYDSAIIVKDVQERIIQWLHKEEMRECVKNCVNAGLHFFSEKIFQYFPEKKKLDLDRDILRPLLEKERIYAYQSPEYVKDMGTPERFHQVEDDLQNGIVKKKNLRYKQKAVFLDRDGTLNVYKGFLTNVGEMELVPEAAEAVRLINQSEYLAIVVTNQPVIARGDCTLEELQFIHNRMEELLGEQGAYVDDIFFCPHHPDKGFEGERLEYKMECECRKPKPGLLLEAAEKYNIDLSESYMIGDSNRDIKAGKNAGCKESFWIQNNRQTALFYVKYILQLKERK